jgi:hypothetical protein
MNWKDIKKLIRKEINEATTVDAGGSKFNLRTGVNKNPTKLGIKIQFEPKGGMLDTDVKNKLESLTGKKVDAPTTAAPEPEGEVTPEIAPEDADIEEMIQAEMLNEMRVRDLNEISKVIMKEDFYAFINAGNNVLRTLEENGRSVSEAKKYLGYLVKHNII